jgi:N-methylhydantoinase B
VSLDPVTLQVMIGGLRAACDEMGAVLIRSAHSANIKERHDCSTALFDAAGELVMQAEHIPVHLGSMPEAVGAVLDEDHAPGDLWILNDPYRGGTHLPDITLISPVFAGGAPQLLGFAASRAHHADIGGPTPGGMPADSRTLEEEGVVIAPTRVDDEGLAELAGRMRNPAQRRADLRAQRAANLLGARRLEDLGHPGAQLGVAVALGELLEAPGWPRSSTTGSDARGRGSRISPTAPTRPPTSSRTTSSASRATSRSGSRRRSTATRSSSTSRGRPTRSRETSTARWR